VSYQYKIYPTTVPYYFIVIEYSFGNVKAVV
jgi:hypothetical protein